MTDMRTARTVTIDSRLDEIAKLSEWVDENLRDRGFAESLVFNIQVCVEEVVGNIVLHAFNSEAGHPIDVTLEVGATDVRLDVRDGGPPFDPREVVLEQATSLSDATVGGNGIRLLRGLSQRMDYARRDGTNVLSLTFAPRTGP